MANNEPDRTNSSSTALEKGLGVLDRSWDAQWALRLICLVLFLDMAMIMRTERGLWQWLPEDKALLSDVGWIALTVVSFSTIFAIVMPVILTLLQQLVFALWHLVPSFHFLTRSEAPYRRSLGNVPIYKFHDLALSERDEFLYQLYKAERQRKDAIRRSRIRDGELTATALVAALADWLIAHQWQGSIGVISGLSSFLGDYALFVLTIVLLSGLIMLKWAWFPPYKPDEIYFPPLDRQLREEEERRKKKLY
ncbi:hypothetical protein H0A66_11075 [Alcaligenaceae bacterium]|nr:hypothetical protein [Alcaligenaceae bacterium]